MANIKVTVSELQAAADTITKSVDAYRSAAAKLKEAADRLADTWEGDSQKDFAEKEAEANEWYNKMADVAQQYADQMKAAAARYAETDQQAASVIKSK